MLRYRVEKLVAWPGTRTHGSLTKRATFKMSWSSILDMLERELFQLGAENVVMKLEIANERRDIRNDGTMREDARPMGSAVVIEFTATAVEGSPRLTYPCDTFQFWQHNVRAIAGALEGLRTVERYGVKAGGRQYQGFKALPEKTATTLSVQAAAEILSRESGSHQVANIMNSKAIYTEAVRAARARAHPDKNAGRTDLWEAVERARVVLEGYHAHR